ncbi:MAG: exodeoxyribonuclease VII large subunit [Sideroxydans sp.]
MLAIHFLGTIVESNRILSVRELNLAVKQIIEGGLPLLWVRGEISNFVVAASGHWYFSLKDQAAQVRCVMFRQKSQFLDFRPSNGMQVEVLALPTLYEARGDFQLNLEKMRPAGLGALFEAFQRLKERLQGEGLFDPVRKRPLPRLPRQIGIVTSPQAAALRDVLRTLQQRMPTIPVVLYPAPVQGEGAGDKIARAIQSAGTRAECDVLIVCRGGGSIEDLWAFNEEAVARAIAGCPIPVVSGVGHETDFTIADFVADLRAATPTAAAQAVVPDRQELRGELTQQANRLRRAMQRRLEQAWQGLDLAQRRLLHPSQRIQLQAQRLDALHRRLYLAGASSLQRAQLHWQQLLRRLAGARPNLGRAAERLVLQQQRLQRAMQQGLAQHELRLAAMQQHLLHLDPQQVLARGYSLVRDAQGRLVTAAAQISVGDPLKITFAQGAAAVRVEARHDAP